MSLSPLIDASDLLGRLDDVVLLDARTGPDAHGVYARSHLAGAIFVDLESELSRPTANPARGGRHPLPSIESFAATVGRWSIDPSRDVVVCDAQSGANAAARAWWMLRAIGHARVRVLDGGYDAAVRAGLPTTDEAPTPRDRGPYPASTWTWPILTIEDVDAWQSDPRKLLIDARSPERFRGEQEPIDPVPGHIPGASNLFHLSLVGADAKLLPPRVIEERARALLRDRAIEDVAVYCGSGVTACHLILELVHAGFGVPALYVGSWGEWCRTPRPRASGEAVA